MNTTQIAHRGPLDAGMLLSSQEAALVVSLREGRMLAFDVDARAMDAGLAATALGARVGTPDAAQLGAESLDAGALWLANTDEDALEAIGLGAAPLDAAALEHLVLASEHTQREAKAHELRALQHGARASARVPLDEHARRAAEALDLITAGRGARA